jgi:hypothetical protein
MVLAGHLTDYPLSELLFFLSSKQRSGELVLTRDSVTITLRLHVGRLVSARPGSTDQRLGSRLVADGILTPQQLSQALVQQKAGWDRQSLGGILVELGIVKPETIRRVVQEQIADCLVQLLMAPGGTFMFNSATASVSGVEVDINIEREVLDAIRRIDEVVTAQIDLGIVVLDRDVTAAELQPVIADGWELIDALMDDASTVDDIVARTGWPRDSVISGLSRLLMHNIISVARPAVAESVAA